MITVIISKIALFRAIATVRGTECFGVVETAILKVAFPVYKYLLVCCELFTKVDQIELFIVLANWNTMYNFLVFISNQNYTFF